MIDPYAFAIWWCCLHPYEHAVSLSLASTYASLVGFITVEAYDALWLAVAGSAALKRAAAYHANYHLVLGVFDPSGEDPIDVYYFEVTFWTAFTVFLLTPPAGCPDGCRELNFT